MTHNEELTQGFLMIDTLGNAVLVNMRELKTSMFLEGTARHSLNLKQLDKVIRHYKKTGVMIPEEELK